MGKIIDLEKVEKILEQAKKLAKDYYDLTKKPLGITGEVAEVSAAKELKLELSDDARQPGYDAIRKEKDGKEIKIQIKGRCVPTGKYPGRMPSINTDKPWDTVLLVILDDKLDVQSMHEAKKDKVKEALDKPGSKSRNIRRALSVSTFKSISKQVWPKKDA